MSIDEQHISLPKLYGAPAYARPPTPVAVAERPFDPDELPLEAHQTDEEREFSSTLPARAYAPGGADLGKEATTGSKRRKGLRPRFLQVRSKAGPVVSND